MFAPRYFAPRYFAPRFWPPGAEEQVVGVTFTDHEGAGINPYAGRWTYRRRKRDKRYYFIPPVVGEIVGEAEVKPKRLSKSARELPKGDFAGEGIALSIAPIPGSVAPLLPSHIELGKDIPGQISARERREAKKKLEAAAEAAIRKRLIDQQKTAREIEQEIASKEWLAEQALLELIEIREQFDEDEALALLLLFS